MNAALWILQSICAMLFLLYGLRKLCTPREQLRQRIAWTEQTTTTFVRFIGCLEIAGALGLVLPGITGVWTILTPIAATALAILMVLGAALHARRREYREILRHEPWFFASFIFIAWARFGSYQL